MGKKFQVMESVLKIKSYELARSVVSIYQLLISEKKEFVMSKQLLRAGTCVGAMIREAQNAESKGDFIHKLGIAQKECDETLYWLELLNDSRYLSEDLFLDNHKKATEIFKMIKSSILTTKKNLQK